MVVYKRVTQTGELEQILKLQKKNLPKYLSPEEMDKEGFVTVDHGFELLKKMNEACPHIIAKNKNRVVGYALCMHPRFANEIEVLRPMFDQIEKVLPKNTRYIVMGQICIDKDYRGSGIFRKLYKTMGYVLKPNFDCIVTEVDSTNRRSLSAHCAIGFKVLKTYLAGEREWKLIALE